RRNLGTDVALLPFDSSTGYVGRAGTELPCDLSDVMRVAFSSIRGLVSTRGRCYMLMTRWRPFSELWNEMDRLNPHAVEVVVVPVEANAGTDRVLGLLGYLGGLEWWRDGPVHGQIQAQARRHRLHQNAHRPHRAIRRVAVGRLVGE